MGFWAPWFIFYSRDFQGLFASSALHSAAALRGGELSRLIGFVLASFAKMCEASSFWVAIQNLSVCSCSLCCKEGIPASRTATSRPNVLNPPTMACAATLWGLFSTDCVCLGTARDQTGDAKFITDATVAVYN
jgi:hypothetical protein